MRAAAILTRLEERLVPAGVISLLSPSDPAAPPDTAGGLSEFAGGGGGSSADGRYTAFTSTAANMVAGQSESNSATDVFLFDRVSATTSLVSHAAAAPLRTAAGASDAVTVSPDGRYVFFRSTAPDLVPSFVDNNGPEGDLYRYDRLLGTNQLISRAAAGPAQGQNGKLGGYLLSFNGEIVAYSSTATNVIAGYSGSNQQAYLFDCTAGTTTLLSHAPGLPTTGGKSFGTVGGVSDDGQRVLYSSGNAFLLDRSSGSVTLVSHKYDSPTTAVGGAGTGMSGDGTKVVFISTATTVVPGFVASPGTTGNYYIKNLVTGSVALITHSGDSMTTGVNARIDGVDVSTDGSVVVLTTKATNLVSAFVPGKANASHIYVYDVASKTNLLVSRSSGTVATGANGNSISAQVSGDGRFIVFSSEGTDIVPGFIDNNNFDGRDVYTYDRLTGTIVLTSEAEGLSSHGCNDWVSGGRINRDGNVILIATEADNLQSTLRDTNNQSDVYLIDRPTGAVTIASRRFGAASATAAGEDDYGSTWVQQSADGRFVVYPSTASNMVPGQVDANRAADIFLHDRMTGTTQLVSRAAGQPARAGNGKSAGPVISRDGRYVAYCSRATDLVPGFVDSNGQPPGVDFHDYGDVFLFDRLTGTNQLVSRAAGTTVVGGNLTSGDVSPSFLDTLCISDDGRYVGYTSIATDLIAGYVEGDPWFRPTNVYVFDRVSGTNALVSRDAAMANRSGDDRSQQVTISGDGRYVVYRSDATNLVAGMVSFGRDVYLFDQMTGETTLVSHAFGAGLASGNGLSDTPVISRNGKFVMYSSDATDLVGGVDANGEDDLFLYDRETGLNTLVSHAFGSPTTAANGWTLFGAADLPPRAISDDGRYVVYSSIATNLVEGFVDNNGSATFADTDTYLFDRITGKNMLVSHAVSSVVAGGSHPSFFSTISGDGRFVAFRSWAADLVDGMTYSNAPDCFVFDQLTGKVALISGAAAGLPGANLGAGYPWINQDGSVVVFWERSENLVANDFNGFQDVFAYVTVPPRVEAVVIADGSPQRSVIRSLTVTFDQPVFFAGEPAEAFELARNGTVVSDQWAVVSQNNPSTVTITFTGSVQQFGSLIDGRYALRVRADQVSNIGPLDGNSDGVGGDDFTFNFHRLFGDADGNGSVDALDFRAFRAAFGSASAVFDLDNDGDTDAADYVAFRGRFGVSV